MYSTAPTDAPPTHDKQHCPVLKQQLSDSHIVYLMANTLVVLAIFL